MSEGMSRWRGRCSGRGARAAASALIAMAWLAIGSAHADALIARGHVLGFSFAQAGGGADETSQPGSIAVDEATGDVYLVDTANERIDRFSRSGHFIAAWGWGVRNGEGEYQICSSECEPGLAGAGRGQLDHPGAIAIDNSREPSDPSRGDIYVVADGRAGHGRLLKMSPDGAILEAIKQAGTEAKWEGTLDGLSVDGSGRLWVYRGVETTGLVERFSNEDRSKLEVPETESSVTCPKPGFAVDGSGESLYADHEREDREGLCPLEEGEAALPVVVAKLDLEEEALTTRFAALEPQQTNAIATEDSSGDTYLANVGSFARFTAEGRLIERVALPGESPSSGGVTVDGTSGQVYVTDTASGKVDVFELEQPAPPRVTALAAENLTPSSARLTAQIDPAGADTHYYFQYGTSSCTGSPDPCTDIPAPPGVDLGSAFGDQAVAVELQDLQPSTTYYFRVLAANENGQAEGSETFGSITTLPTAEGVLADNRAWELVSPVEKDGSGIEPLRKEGGVIQASEDGSAITYVANGPIVAEPEGNRSPYPTQAIATRSPSGWSTQQIVTPRTKGEGFVPGEAPEYRAFSGDLSAGLVEPDNHHNIEPLEQPPLSPQATEKTMYVRENASGSYLPLVTAADDTAGTKFGEQLEFLDATPDLSHVVFSSGVSLVDGAAPGLYEWQRGAPLAPVSVLPKGGAALEPELGEEGHNVRGALSDDGTRVIWTGESEVTNGASTETVRHLYMRDMDTGQTLQLDAAAPPTPEPGEEESEVGFQGANSNGTRVFFTDTARLTEESTLAPEPGAAGNPADLYECEIVETAGELSCELHDLTVDQLPSESADVLNVAPAVSEDGSFVYFVANGVLAPGASRGDCVHQDAETPPPEATCNLYVWHRGTISFIATLSNEDSGDWGSTVGPGTRGMSVEPRPDFASVTAGSSPDGEYLAFMSDRSLTGYDNIDSSPAADGSRAEEVYLYHASTKLLLCASCNPDGQPPDGVFDTGDAGEGLGLVVDRAQNWAASSPEARSPTAHWLAGSLPGWTPLGNEGAQALRPPRYLSDSGRLFFDSADPLVRGAQARTRQETVGGQPVQVGVESVYEYEQHGTGSCAQPHGCVSLISSGTAEQESSFVDASTDGDDAFFVTSQPLVAQDTDTNFDLYDARVCTVQSQCLTSEGAASEPCASTEACREGLPPITAPGRSGTSAYTGPGNTPRVQNPAVAKPKPKPLTRAQKLAKAIKACRAHWRHSSRKRAACERRARRTYAAKKANSRPKSRRR